MRKEMQEIVPTQCFPIVKRFLKSNQFSSSAQKFEKETKSEIQELKSPSLEELLSFWLEHHPKDVKKFVQEEEEEEQTDKKKKKSNKSESKKRKVEEEEEEEEEEKTEKKKDKKKKKQKTETKEDSDEEDEKKEKELTKKERKKAEKEEKEEKEAKKLEKKKEKKEKKKVKEDNNDEEEEGEKKEKDEDEEPMKVTNPQKNFAQKKEVNEEETFNQSKGSKKNTPFKRISEDYYVGQSFRDNTFESKNGDEFGAKANAILSKVRGKGFRHEKTKKKRGTYSGGAIDMGVNSIKFVNSDDE
eukprot:TRINITY_DN621_c0_g1_i1.p1 TRINITY_DN621_c0_g1~~TRINITY_DN621_c0_g1_i1.p1  ORF type:complete len:300 (+),score=170.67 TRINITY_DN621_c0_g1_i1:205-1104(+)